MASGPTGRSLPGPRRRRTGRTLRGVPRAAFLAVVLTALVAAAGGDLGSDEERAWTERPREAQCRGDSGPARLANRLRRGGYLLAFRHAPTDFLMTDSTRDLRESGEAAEGIRTLDLLHGKAARRTRCMR
jgi:hypothetical protein